MYIYNYTCSFPSRRLLRSVSNSRYVFKWPYLLAPPLRNRSISLGRQYQTLGPKSCTAMHSTVRANGTTITRPTSQKCDASNYPGPRYRPTGNIHVGYLRRKSCHRQTKMRLCQLLILLLNMYISFILKGLLFFPK